MAAGRMTYHGFGHAQLLCQCLAVHILRGIEEVADEGTDGARVGRRPERQEEERVPKSCNKAQVSHGATWMPCDMGPRGVLAQTRVGGLGGTYLAT